MSSHLGLPRGPYHHPMTITHPVGDGAVGEVRCRDRYPPGRCRSPGSRVAAGRPVGAVAGLGQPGRGAHRGRHRAVAGADGRIGGLDRVGARRRGARRWPARWWYGASAAIALLAQCRAPRPTWCGAVVLADRAVHRGRIHPRPHRRTPRRNVGGRHRLDGGRLVADAGAGPGQSSIGHPAGLAATEGEGTQNYLCAAQAGGVLVGLAITAFCAGGWWVDPAIGLAIAGVAVWQGSRAWRGHDCGC